MVELVGWSVSYCRKGTGSRRSRRFAPVAVSIPPRSATTLPLYGAHMLHIAAGRDHNGGFGEKFEGWGVSLLHLCAVEGGNNCDTFAADRPRRGSTSVIRSLFRVAIG